MWSELSLIFWKKQILSCRGIFSLLVYENYYKQINQKNAICNLICKVSSNYFQSRHKPRNFAEKIVSVWWRFPDCPFWRTGYLFCLKIKKWYFLYILSFCLLTLTSTFVDQLLNLVTLSGSRYNYNCFDRLIYRPTKVFTWVISRDVKR